MTRYEKIMGSIGIVVWAAVGYVAIARPTDTVIDLPSCPLELTLQDGSRMSMPDWGRPGCKAVIGWQVP